MADFAKDDVIDFALLPNDRLIVFRCIESNIKHNPHSANYHASNVECPACASEDTIYINEFGSYCRNCYISWTSESTYCLACMRPLRNISAELMLCEWCGQKWDIELIKDAYLNGDEKSMINFSTARGANK